MTLTLFITLTVGNVVQLVHHYLQYPTVIHPHIQSSTASSTIGNLTLKLQFSVFEFDALGFRGIPDFKDYSGYNVDESVINWCYTIEPNVLSLEIQDKIQSISEQLKDLGNLTRWHQDLGNVSLSLPNQTLSWSLFLQLMHSYEEMLNEILAWELPNDRLFARFVIEEQLKEFTFITDLFGLSLSWPGLHYALMSLGSNGKGEQRQLFLQAHNCTMTQMVESVHDWPRLFILSNAGRVQLKNFSLDSEAKTHELTYEVSVPADVRELTVRVHSVRLSLLLWRLHALTKHGRRRLLEVPTVTYGQLFCKTDWQNGMEMLMKELQAHYRATSIFELNTESGSVFLEPFVNTRIEMFPTAHFTSETSKCMEYSMQTCVDQCEYELYLAACHCTPWSLLYLRTNGSVCQQICVLPNSNRCHQDCGLRAQHPCDKTAYRLERSYHEIKPFEWHQMFWDLWGEMLDQTLKFVPDSPVTVVQLSLPLSHSHAMYLEQYSMSIGDLISRIGGLLEFFLGINVVAIVHLFVYIVQNTCSHDHRRLESIFVKLGHFRKVLLHKPKRNKFKRRCRILLCNSWYEETTLTGWSFINNARSMAEACFWAALLLMFFIFTVNSLVQILAEYARKPKKTTLYMVFQNHEKGIENFSMVLEASFFEYTQNDLSDTIQSLYDLDFNINSCIYAMEAFGDNWNLVAVKIQESIHNLTHDENFLRNLAEETNLKQIQNDTFQSWFSNVSDSLTPEMDILFNESHYRYDRVETKFFDDIQEKFRALVWSNLLWVLHVLECNKLGVDPRWKAMHDFKIINGPPNTFHKYQEARDILANNGINPKNLLHTTNPYLTKQIGLSHGEVHLIDAKNNMGDSIQQLTFKVLPNQESNQLILNIYSYSISHHLLAWRSLTDYLALRIGGQQQGSDQGSCHGAQLGNNIHWRALLRDLFLFREHMLEVDSLVLQLPSASAHIRLQPFSDAQIMLQPTGRYSVPETQNCYGGSLDACETDCVLEWHTKHCDCAPWSVFYLAQHVTLCHGQCVVYNQTAPHYCSAHCNRKMAIKCTSTTYRVQSTELRAIRPYYYNIHERRYFVDPTLPVYRVRLRKAEMKRHPVFNEQYQMNLGNLLAHMGGILELWLGINIMGIIHLIVFIVRHFVTEHPNRADLCDR